MNKPLDDLKKAIEGVLSNTVLWSEDLNTLEREYKLAFIEPENDSDFTKYQEPLC